MLSFDQEEEEENLEDMKPPTKKKFFGKNPDVVTHFLKPTSGTDKDKLEEEVNLKKKLIEEYF